MDWHSTGRFPGESPNYRAARDELLAAECDLRKRVEQVAELRRKLPSKQVRKFHRNHGRRIREGLDTLALYKFMYGPAMKQACPMCTSFLDSLNGTAPHAAQRLNLAVAAKSPIGRIREFARGRGWHNLRLLSSGGTPTTAIIMVRLPMAVNCRCLAYLCGAPAGSITHTVRNWRLLRRSPGRTSGTST